MARVLLSEQTADRIQQMIDRQYKPGEKIPAEMELADFLGVSRTTIREAVKILCSRHILEIRRGYGTFVCENPGVPTDPLGSKFMDEEQLKTDIFEMSQLLEPELVRLAARKASDESIARMKEIHEEMKEKLSRYRAGEFIHTKEFRKLDVDFHQAVIQGCENQIISRSLPMFVASCSEWYNVWTSLDFGKVLDSFETYHPKILAAVEAHDPDMAYQYSREHTQEIIDIYRSQKKTEI
jgi:DNA-binding FadR family transcriptional regulator